VGKGGTDMGDHGSIVGMVTGMVVQLRENRFDSSLHLSAIGARYAWDKGWIEPPLQFH
jgi:hypothetical protein